MIAQWSACATELGSLARLERATPATVFAELWPERAAIELDPRARFDRVYFGSELCEHLAPTARELDEALQRSRDMGAGFSFLTYGRSDESLAKLELLLDRLSERATPEDGLEIVVNDLGTLRMVARRHPALALVLGRQMKRYLKDHRLPFGEHSVGWDEAELEAFLELGVSRLELDLPAHGTLHLTSAPPLPLSLYFPATVLATGRVCMSGSFHRARKDKFTVDGPCRRECRLVTWALEAPASPGILPVAPADAELRLIQKGNTVFVLPSKPVLERALAEAPGLGVDRIVFQPGYPL